jgi:Ran-binding protein 9/10
VLIRAEEIRAAILEGDIDRALKLMAVYYPSVLRDNENIYFKMRCRKFVEMIRRTAELADGTSPSLAPTKGASASSSHHDRHDDYNGIFDQEMELDEFGTTRNGTSHNGSGDVWEDGGAMDTSEDLYTQIGRKEMGYSEMMTETLQYGRELREEFEGDPRREVKKGLEDTFALIAYADPRDSPMASMLDDSERAPVAEELNGAILGTLTHYLLASPLNQYADLLLNSQPRQIVLFRLGTAHRSNRRAA